MKRLFAPITKVEDQSDGTLKVYGYASTGATDEDGETILPEAIKAALPDYLKWGAVREMHQPKAVGTAIEANVQDDGRTWFGAHVVDPVAVKKVQTKVLKGFSVGGRVTDRDEVEKTTITGIKLIEVSLVDRPANPECEILIAKRSASAALDDLVELLKVQTVDAERLLDAADDIAKAEDKKPYGDVAYADPGYQDDGKKRYPIDTEEHIRAAWNYINKEKNQKPYSAAQVASIKRRIVAAWKSKIDKEGPPSASDGKAAAGDETLRKGLYNVQQFAQCLEALGWVAMSAQGEFDWEGDGSPVPERLRQWMADGAEIFKEMAAEEVDELVESLSEQAGIAIERVLKGANMELQLSKVGAKFSAATKKALSEHEEHLGKLHKMAKDLAGMCKEACDKAAALGHHEEGDGEGDGDGDENGKAARAAALAGAAAQAAAGGAAADPAKLAQAQAANELAGIIKAAVAEGQAQLLARIEKMEKATVGGVPFVNEEAARAYLASRGITPAERGGGAGATAGELQIDPVQKIGGGLDEGATVTKALIHPSRGIPDHQAEARMRAAQARQG